MALRHFGKLIYKSGPKVIQFSILIVFRCRNKKTKKLVRFEVFLQVNPKSTDM